MDHASLLIKQIEALSSPGGDVSALQVSKRSSVGDLIWDFSDDIRHVPRTVNRTKLMVDWGKHALSAGLRQDAQRVFALYWKAPQIFAGRGQIKPNTLCSRIRHGLAFLEHVVGRLPSPDLIQGLDEFEDNDLRGSARTYSGKSITDVRKSLKVLFAFQTSVILGRQLRVTEQDIKNLDFPVRPSVRRGVYHKWFSDQLFTLISSASTARVKDFLEKMEVETEDQSPEAFKAPSAIEIISDFRKTFSSYEQWRRKAKGIPISDQSEGRLRKTIEESGGKLGGIRDYLFEINAAAQCIIALYTGARYSELASLECGCVVTRDGVPCVVGRVYKTKADNLVSDDAWVAIPVVLDAVKALELLATIKNKRFLFSSLETAKRSGLKGKDNSYSADGFCRSLERYLGIIDRENRYSGWRFRTNQFRHSLSRQMVMAKLGMPYISFQLKHLHMQVACLPNEVSLGYGNAAGLIQSEAAGVSIEEVRRGIAGELYDPDSIVHGGGAEAFSHKRRVYFEGMTDAGMSREEIVDSLAAMGSSLFANVGLGYCTGRKDNPATGERPPCIGSLRCNPVRCSNAIVTKQAHGPAWKKVYIENRRMAKDPRFSYAKSTLEAMALEARMVLERLGEDPEDDTRSSI